MNVLPIGDLARTLVNQSQSRLLKSQQAQHTQELTTGQVADPIRQLSGDMATLSSLVRARSLQESFIRNNQETAQLADAMQVALDTVNQSADDLLDVITIGPQTNLPNLAEMGRTQAINSLDAMFSALNANIAGRHLFSGIDVETPPLADLQVMLDEIDFAITGTSGPADIVAAIDAFFDTGGGYETLVYQGATDDLSPIPIDERESVSLDFRADDTAIRDALKGAAYVFAAGSPSVTLNEGDKRDLLIIARDFTYNSKDTVHIAQGEVGFAQQRIEDTLVRLRAEEVETEKARTDLLGIDSFEAATRLEDVNARLELLYAVTARTARLSFLEFMR